MSEFGKLFEEAEKKMIVVPEKYRYLRIAAAIARDQLGLDANFNVTPEENVRRFTKQTNGKWLVEWDRLIVWYEAFETYRNMLRPEIVFSTTIPPDVVVISEGRPVGSNVLPMTGTWNTLADRLPRHETKDGPHS